MSKTEDPKQLAQLLGLEQHPEGRYFKETFRDSDNLPGGRPTSSLIYFLLEEGNHSNLHRIDAAEGWHFYAGQGTGVEVIELEAEGPRVTQLGMDIAAGQRPQHVVAKNRWFGARVRGEQAGGVHSWALVGCSVAPAFDFGKFELGKRDVLLKEFPACKNVIAALTPES